MGKKSHAAPDGFAAELNAYLAHLLNQQGRQDLSGRWLETATDGARSRDYWAGFVKNDRAMNTNDIDVLAKLFGMSPFEFVRNARELADVGPHPEDFHVSEDPGDALPHAAETERKPE